MNEVKRWGHKERLGVIFSEERPDGKFVKYEDYAALKEQLTATTNSLTNAQEALKSAGIEADTVQAGVMELKGQRDALAVECSALLNANDLALDIICDDNTFVAAEWKSSTAKIRVETPATDAYLNAVRAEGVEMFARKCSEKSKQAASSDMRDIWWLGGENASDFAAQLRSGNAGKDGV